MKQMRKRLIYILAATALMMIGLTGNVYAGSPGYADQYPHYKGDPAEYVRETYTYNNDTGFYNKILYPGESLVYQVEDTGDPNSVWMGYWVEDGLYDVDLDREGTTFVTANNAATQGTIFIYDKIKLSEDVNYALKIKQAGTHPGRLGLIKDDPNTVEDESRWAGLDIKVTKIPLYIDIDYDYRSDGRFAVARTFGEGNPPKVLNPKEDRPKYLDFTAQPFAEGGHFEYMENITESDSRYIKPDAEYPYGACSISPVRTEYTGKNAVVTVRAYYKTGAIDYSTLTYHTDGAKLDAGYGAYRDPIVECEPGSVSGIMALNIEDGHLPVPMKSGYTFCGWYQDKAFTDGPYDKAENMTCWGGNKYDYHLYAKWEAIGKEYDLWVGSTRVTDGNAKDVLGDGTVRFDTSENTLTLNAATITDVYDEDGVAKANIYTTLPKLTITGRGSVASQTPAPAAILTCGTELIIHGNGKGISATGADYGIVSDKTLELSGTVAASGMMRGIQTDNDLNISKEATILAFATSKTPSMEPVGIQSTAGTITINGGTVQAEGLSGGIRGNKGVVINDGKVTAASGSSSVIPCEGISAGNSSTEGTLTINGGTIDAQGGSSIRGRGLTATGQVIINGGTVNAGGFFGIQAPQGITIGNGIKKVQATAAGSIFLRAAVTTGQNNTGTISLGDSIGITLPSGGKLSADAHDVYEADGKTTAKDVIFEPVQKYTLKVLTSHRSCQVEYDGQIYNSGQTFKIEEGKEVLLNAKAGSSMEFDDAVSDDVTLSSSGSLGRTFNMPDHDVTETFNFIPIQYITTVDIGKIWTKLDPINEIPFTAEIHNKLDEDNVNFTDKMEITNEFWSNVDDDSDQISLSSPGKLKVNNTYRYSIQIKAKKGWAFRNPEDSGLASWKPTFGLVVGGTAKTFGKFDNCAYGSDFKTVTFGPMDMDENDGHFTVLPVDITAAEVTGIEDQAYTGSALDQDPVVKMDVNGTDVTLEKETDFDLSYSPDNVNPGTVTMTITGKGNYTGEIKRTFEITGGPGSDPSGGSGSSEGTAPAADPKEQKGDDGTPFGKGASVEAAEAAVLALPDDNDPAGTAFGPLQFKATKTTKTSIKLTWKAVPGANRYILFANRCGKGNKYIKLGTVTGTSYTATQAAGATLRKGTYYKFMLIAAGSNGKVVSTSKTVHVATKGGKVGNHKSVKVSKSIAKKAKKLKKGKTLKLKAKAVPQTKKLKVRKHRAVRYETSNPAVALVNGKGTVKGVGKGTCYVYAYAQNGVCAKVKVTVK